MSKENTFIQANYFNLKNTLKWIGVLVLPIFFVLLFHFLIRIFIIYLCQYNIILFNSLERIIISFFSPFILINIAYKIAPNKKKEVAYIYAGLFLIVAFFIIGYAMNIDTTSKGVFEDSYKILINRYANMYNIPFYILGEFVILKRIYRY